MGLQLTGRKRRFCVLEGATVRYYESLDDKQQPKNLKGTIVLTGDTAVEVKDHRLLVVRYVQPGWKREREWTSG